MYDLIVSKLKVFNHHYTESFRVDFKHINTFNIRYDLYDTMIEVCHLNVLTYYHNEFDFKVL